MTRRFRASLDDGAFDVEVDGPNVRVNAADATPANAAKATNTGKVADAATPPSAGTAPSAATPADAGASSRAFVIAPAVVAAAAGSVRVEAPDGAAAASAHLAVSGETTWVFIDGEVWTIDVEPAERVRRERSAGAADGLGAPMPATVIRILAEPGRDVRRGETLLLLEAMKMELPVRAPRDGRVAAIHCQTGELVQPGVPLVELE